MNVLPSFDGAMNLLPAKNWALFGKYYSFYFQEYFPRPIQTRFTLQLPSALLYYLFGINRYTVLLVPSLYAITFPLLFHRLLGSIITPRFALLGLLVVFIIPRYFIVGLRGWGEIIAYSYVLLSLFCLVRVILAEKVLWTNIVLAGAFLGLGLITKTIVLFSFPAYGIVLLYCYSNKLITYKDLFYFVLGGVLSLFVFTLFQISLLGFSGYYEWVSEQWLAVSGQSGINSKSGTRSFIDQLIFRSIITFKNSGVPTIFNLLFFALPLILVGAIMFLRIKVDRSRVVILTFSLIVVWTYLFWWLVMSPEIKMTSLGKFRRILPAYLFNYASLIVAVQLIWECELKVKDYFKSIFLLTAMFTIFGFIYYNMDYLSELLNKMVYRENPYSHYEHGIYKGVDVPENSSIYGYGYKQAPVFALLYDGVFSDITRSNYREFIKEERSFIVLDGYSRKTGAFRAIKEMHDFQLISDSNSKKVMSLYEHCGLKQSVSAISIDDLKSCLKKDEIREYENKYGFYNKKQNWTAPSFAVVLSGGDYSELSLKIYLQSFEKYRGDYVPEISLSMNGKLLLNLTLNEGLKTYSVPLNPTDVSKKENYIIMSMNTSHESDRNYYGCILNSICLN